MKRHLGKAAAVVAASVVLFGSGAAQASDNITVTVNATVVGVCKFNSTAPVVNISNTGTGSNIDPSLTSNATGVAAINYKCSNGTSPTFTVPATATVSCAACTGTPTMAATMTSTNGGAGTGLGSGQDKVLSVTGTIGSAIYQNAAAGSYTGSITVSVSP